nr:PREDICTED: uncharacterized protein LOC102354387 isoform X5 [Latimeria chalumnae]|eukprot:XP_014340620.1 PREDICTED: uncharacterized protein LOC102354387 isoform X5 [Latimeria chalumnae]
MAVLRDPLKMAVPSEQSSDYDTRPTTSQGKKGIAANYSESSSADGIAFGKPGASFPWGSRNRLLYTLLRGDSSSCSDSLSSFSSFSFPKPFKHINSYLLNPSKRSGLTSSSTTFTQRDSSMPATDSDTSSHILSSSNPQVEESSLASDVCNQNLSSSASQFERNSSVLSTDSCSLLPDSTDSQYTYYMNFLSQPSLLSYLEEVIQKTVEQLLSAKTADGISLFNVVEPKAEKKNPPPEENKTSEVFTAFRCHSNISSVSESLSALLGKDTKANGTLNNKKHLPSQKQKASSVKPPLAVKADVPTSCSPALTFDSKLESERLAKKKLPYSKKRKPKSAPKDKKGLVAPRVGTRKAVEAERRMGGGQTTRLNSHIYHQKNQVVQTRWNHKAQRRSSHPMRRAKNGGKEADLPEPTCLSFSSAYSPRDSYRRETWFLLRKRKGFAEARRFQEG